MKNRRLEDWEVSAIASDCAGYPGAGTRELVASALCDLGIEPRVKTVKSAWAWSVLTSNRDERPADVVRALTSVFVFA